MKYTQEIGRKFQQIIALRFILDGLSLQWDLSTFCHGPEVDAPLLRGHPSYTSSYSRFCSSCEAFDATWSPLYSPSFPLLTLSNLVIRIVWTVSKLQQSI